jgi:tripartite ATP-independent transporter DctP family solute receptor
MTRFHRLTGVLLLGVALSLLPGCQEGASQRTLRLSHVLDAAHPVHQAMQAMGDRLEVLSDGALTLKIYPGGQLGNERESLELLQLGMLDFAKVASSVLENFVPAMGVFSLPYLFRDSDHYWQVFSGDVGREILAQADQYRIRGLCYYDAGFRSFYTSNQAIRTPADLAGQKIRVMRSNISIQAINLLGGSATPMAYGEIYTALQQGVVDGAENNPPNFFQSKHFDVSGYYSLDEHAAPPDVLLIGSHTWDNLSEQERGWLEQAVAESVEVQRELWERATEEALAQVQAAGIEVIRPDKEAFRDIVEPLYAELDGTELGTWARRIRELAPPDTTGGDPE